MANTYTQIYLHIVFAVKNRASLIKPEYEEELYSYIAGICKHRKHFLRAIGGTSDHLHLFVGMHPAESVSTLVQNIKMQTSKWTHERFNVVGFEWQTGFGAYSYSKAFIPQVENYILNQKNHHKRISFEDEMRELYRIAGIDYDERYMLKGVEDAKSGT